MEMRSAASPEVSQESLKKKLLEDIHRRMDEDRREGSEYRPAPLSTEDKIGRTLSHLSAMAGDSKWVKRDAEEDAARKNNWESNRTLQKEILKSRTEAFKLLEDIEDKQKRRSHDAESLQMQREKHHMDREAHRQKMRAGGVDLSEEYKPLPPALLKDRMRELSAVSSVVEELFKTNELYKKGVEVFSRGKGQGGWTTMLPSSLKIGGVDLGRTVHHGGVRSLLSGDSQADLDLQEKIASQMVVGATKQLGGRIGIGLANLVAQGKVDSAKSKEANLGILGGHIQDNKTVAAGAMAKMDEALYRGGISKTQYDLAKKRLTEILDTPIPKASSEEDYSAIFTQEHDDELERLKAETRESGS